MQTLLSFISVAKAKKKPPAGGHWVTVDGTHVYLSGSGKVEAGPAKLEGHPVDDLPSTSEPEAGKKKPKKPKLPKAPPEPKPPESKLPETQPKPKVHYSWEDAKLPTGPVPHNPDKTVRTHPAELMKLAARQLSAIPQKHDYKLVEMPIDKIKPSQSGEDYVNDSSKYLSQFIGKFGESGRDLDYAPIVVDSDLNILDGNHRHASRRMAGITTIPVLVPTGPGTGKVTNGLAKSLSRLITKAPCLPGQTAAQTGCTPAEGEGGVVQPAGNTAPTEGGPPENKLPQATAEAPKETPAEEEKPKETGIKLPKKPHFDATEPDAKVEAANTFVGHLEEAAKTGDVDLVAFHKFTDDSPYTSHVEEYQQDLINALKAASAPAKTADNVVKPLPTNGLVDVSKWPAHNSSAKWAAKKLAAYDTLSKAGDWEGLEKIKYAPDKPPQNPYQKALVKAYAALKAQQATTDQKAIQSGPQGLLDTSKWTKVGDQLGSNPGGKFKDENGKEWYVKFSKDEDHAKNEVLAAKLYQLAGVGVTDYNLVNTPSGMGTATPWVELAKFNPDSEAEKAEATKGFMTHAWLANWDAVGQGYDNLAHSADGLVTMDTGGSLLYRAQGEPKPFGPKVDEIQSLTNATINPQAAKVFGNMSPDQAYASMSKVLMTNDIAIQKLVDAYGPGDDDAKKKLSETLIARKEDIKKRAEGLLPYLKNLKEAEGAPANDLPKAEKEGMPKLTFPEPPVDPNWTATIAGMTDAAKAGNTQKLEEATFSFLSNVDPAKDMLVDYKNGLLAALKDGAKPPKKTKAKKEKQPKIKADNLPSEPTFQSKNEAQVAANKKAVEEMKALALAGDTEKLMKYESASPKVQAYKNSLVSSVQNQLHPPPPPKKYEGKIDFTKGALATVLKGAKEHGLAKSKIGNYLVVEEPGVPDFDLPSVNLETHASFSHSFKLTDGNEQKRHDAAIAQMPATVKKTITSLTGSGHGPMNASFWNGTPKPAAVNLAKFIINHAPELTPGTFLSRKVSIMEDADLANIDKAVGKVIQEPAFSECSVDPNVWQGNIKLKITTAPGVKGLYVAPISSHESEKEMVLPPGTRFLIKKVLKDPNNYYGREVHVVALPTVKEQCC